LAWAPSIRNEGVLRASTGQGRRAFIHSADIAAVSAAVLQSSAYRGESLAITGPEALTFKDAAAKIGSSIGREIQFETIGDEEAGGRLAATGASVAEVDAHIALWRGIREGRLGVVTDTVERVLGRRPLCFDQWTQENAASFL
jgi:uncharacterized protein YbjT (DUF2867 family)